MYGRAKKYGLTTSMDTQWDPEEKWDLNLETLLPNLDFFLPNEAELLNLTRCSNVNVALQKLSHHKTCIVVKRGANGATMQYQNNLYSAEALHVPNVIDTVGAGDSFNAGFIHAFLQGKDFKSCLEEGIRTAGVSTTEAGGVNAIISYNQVLEKATEFKKK